MLLCKYFKFILLIKKINKARNQKAKATTYNQDCQFHYAKTRMAGTPCTILKNKLGVNFILLWVSSHFRFFA
jgi:hypothetical protein